MAEETNGCQHEGYGAFCHKCGIEFQPEKKDDKHDCSAGHAHMRDNLKRAYCTFCGTCLQS